MALTKITAAGLTADLIDETKLADDSIDSEHYNAASIDNEHLADDAVDSAEIADGAIDLAHLSASGTAGNTTYLRGDNAWATISTGDPGKIELNNTKAEFLDVGSSKEALFITFEGDEAISSGSETNDEIYDFREGSFTSGQTDKICNHTIFGHTKWIKQGGSTGAKPYIGADTNGNIEVTAPYNAGNSQGKVWTFSDYQGTHVSAGNIDPSADSTYSLGLTGTRWTNVYADNLYGTLNGSDLTDDTVTEAKLDISNGPTNGYYLQTNGSGTLTWAAAGGGLTSDSDKNTLGGDNAGDTIVSGQGIQNTFLGYDTGTALEDGDDNTAVGAYALSTAVDNSYNTAVGMNCLKACNTGSKNTAIGNRALDECTSGSENHAFGYKALENLDTGNYNIVIGSEAGNDITSGGGNVILGHKAGDNITTGGNNIVLGYEALTGANTNSNGQVCMGYRAGYGITGDSGHMAIGYEALKTCTTGIRNTGVGFKALRLCTGGQNTALGYLAGNQISTGGGNTAIGHESQNATNIGHSCTSVGYNSMYVNSEGHHNTAVGHNAMHDNTTAPYNDAYGADALYANQTGDNNVAVGYASFKTQTTAGRNTGLGFESGRIATGGSNTCIGFGAGDTITTGSNNTCLGNDATASAADATNEITLGNSSVGTLRCNDTSIGSLSDRRDKTDIIDITIGLDFINTLQPRQFKWQTRDGNIKDGTTRAGFIAQELQAAQTNHEFLDLVYDSNPNRLEAKEGHLIPVLVQAIKDLSTKVNELEEKLNDS